MNASLLVALGAGAAAGFAVAWMIFGARGRPTEAAVDPTVGSVPSAPGPAESEERDELERQIVASADERSASRAAQEAANAQLEFAQLDVVNAAKMAALGQLVAGVAHEINTPMGALNSNHDVIRRALDKLQVILEDERVDPHELDDVRRIVKAISGVQDTNSMAVERMSHIVKSLRTFGRPDRSEVGPLDLEEGIESTLTILGHETRGRIEIERHYGPVPPVECFPNRLNQVFMNLLMNACQAIPETGTIGIRTELAEDGEARIQIRDSGVGMEREVLDRIFEPGFTTKGSRVGMGLGLLITRQIIEQHAGSISAESTPGEGTTFTITLPLRLTAPAPAAEA